MPILKSFLIRQKRVLMLSTHFRVLDDLVLSILFCSNSDLLRWVRFRTRLECYKVLVHCRESDVRRVKNLVDDVVNANNLDIVKLLDVGPDRRPFDDLEKSPVSIWSKFDLELRVHQDLTVLIYRRQHRLCTKFEVACSKAKIIHVLEIAACFIMVFSRCHYDHFALKPLSRDPATRFLQIY